MGIPKSPGLIALAIVSVLAAHQVAAETLLRWTDGSGDRGPRAEAFHWFAETVRARTGGALDFQFHFGGALMGHAANVQGIGAGAADIGQVIGAYTPKELLPYGVGDMPLVRADPWVGMMAMNEMAKTDPTLVAMFDDLNLVHIANLSTGPVQLLCRRVDLDSLEDLRGLKLRASGNYGRALAALGANVISLSQEEVYSALGSGLVSCNQQYIQAILPYRQNEVADQLVLLDWGQILAFGVVMNKDAFEALSPAQQAAILRTGDEFASRYAAILEREIAKAIAAMTDPGSGHALRITALSGVDQDQLKVVSDAQIDRWIADATAAGYPAEEMVETFLALVAKYQAELDENGYPWAAR